MNAREEQNIHSLSACRNKVNSYGKRNDEWVNWMCAQCLGQHILFVVSLLQDDTLLGVNTAAPSVKTLGHGLTGLAIDLYTDRQRGFKPHRRHRSSLETMFLN